MAVAESTIGPAHAQLVAFAREIGIALARGAHLNGAHNSILTRAPERGRNPRLVDTFGQLKRVNWFTCHTERGGLFVYGGERLAGLV